MRNPRCHLPSTLTPRIKTTLFKKLSGAASPPRRAARFNLGNTVCATVSGPVDASRVLRRVQLVNPAGLAVDSLDITTNPQTVTFILPSDTTTIFNNVINPGDSIAIDNRGTWRIVSTETADGGVVASAAITVDGPTPAADLQ